MQRNRAVLVGTGLALYYGRPPVSAILVYMATKGGGINIPRTVGPPLGFFAGECSDALAHLAYEGAQAFGPIAIGCGSDLAGIAYDATYGSGVIPL